MFSRSGHRGKRDKSLQFQASVCPNQHLAPALTLDLIIFFEKPSYQFRHLAILIGSAFSGPGKLKCTLSNKQLWKKLWIISNGKWFTIYYFTDRPMYIMLTSL